MKPLYLLLLSIIASYSGTAQLKRTLSYSAEPSELTLCSGSITLDSLGFFYHESGCEGRGAIAFGKYTLLKEREILLTCLEFDRMGPIIEVTRLPQKVGEDSIISIGFYARDEVPLNGCLSVDVIDSSGKYFKTYHPNEFGLIQINSTTNKSIRIHSADWFMRETKLIEISGVSMKITFNVPINFFSYKSPMKVKYQDLLLVIKDDGLYNASTRERMFVRNIKKAP